MRQLMAPAQPDPSTELFLKVLADRIIPGMTETTEPRPRPVEASRAWLPAIEVVDVASAAVLWGAQAPPAAIAGRTHLEQAQPGDRFVSRAPPPGSTRRNPGRPAGRPPPGARPRAAAHRHADDRHHGQAGGDDADRRILEHHAGAGREGEKLEAYEVLLSD
jgi:hypothetical protein